MKQFGLGKKHKLCSLTDIDRLFAGDAASAALAYPLRAIWRSSDKPRPDDAPDKFLVSVPKKRLKRAVDRVAMRRRIREAYRLNRGAFARADQPRDIAFIYVADRLRPYHAVEAAMKRLLAAIHPVNKNSHEPTVANP